MADYFYSLSLARKNKSAISSSLVLTLFFSTQQYMKMAIRYASSFSSEHEMLCGAIWYHDVGLANRTQQNYHSADSSSQTSMNKSHWVLPLGLVHQTQSAKCLIFTSKDPAEKQRPWHIPVRSVGHTPACGRGLRFSATPRFFSRLTWVNYNNIVYLPLTTLVSVSEHEKDWPRLTREDIGVLLFYNRNLVEYLPLPNNDRRDNQDDDDDGEGRAEEDQLHETKEAAPVRVNGKSSYAQIAKRNSECSHKLRTEEIWQKYMNADWLAQYLRLKSHCDTEDYLWKTAKCQDEIH